MAEHIEATDLGERIAMRQGPTELVSLAASFDAMLDRLHRAAASQHQVIDEISHELRTPIAVLVTNADVHLANRDPSLELYREGLEQSRRTADRMLATLERLLVDARGSARSLDRHPADLMEVLRGVVAEMSRRRGGARHSGRVQRAPLGHGVVGQHDRGACRHQPDRQRASSRAARVDRGRGRARWSGPDRGQRLRPRPRDFGS